MCNVGANRGSRSGANVGSNQVGSDPTSLPHVGALSSSAAVAAAAPIESALTTQRLLNIKTLGLEKNTKPTLGVNLNLVLQL